MVGGDYGWFCQSCPVVVLDKNELEKMIGRGMPGWKVGTEISVAGIVDLDAVPANKSHLPLGEPGNPMPLIKFRPAGSGDSPGHQPRLKK